VQSVFENTSRVLPECTIHLDEVEWDKEDTHGNEAEDSLPADNLQRRSLENEGTGVYTEPENNSSKSLDVSLNNESNYFLCTKINK